MTSSAPPRRPRLARAHAGRGAVAVALVLAAAGCSAQDAETAVAASSDSVVSPSTVPSPGSSPSLVAGVETGAGLVTVPSAMTVADTVSRITAAVEANDALSIVATVDHAAAAQEAGLELPPTTLLLVGNPRAGTPLMQASRSVAIDLPQKLLVWEDEEGQTQVTYNDPAYLAQRHGIEGQDELLQMITQALEMLANGP